MNLKKLLKTLKLNESTISMILGALVIIIIGALVINYFSKKGEGETIPPIGTEGVNTTFPTNYTVAKGDDLWKISEKFYKTGYNWTDIAEANNIKNPDSIEEGTNLIIPNVTPKLLAQENTNQTVAPTNTVTVEPTIEPTAEPTATPTIEPTATPTGTQTNIQPAETEITGDSYTVVKGDNLWKIAVRAYGDGYKWVDIARTNELVKPDLIHPGNQFVIPR